MITPFLIDLLMVFLIVKYGAQHDAFSDRAKVDGGKFPEVSDYHWHVSVWKFRWPVLAYFMLESYLDLLPLFDGFHFLALLAPLAVLFMASAHDFYYFKYRRELAKYADGRARPEWINRLAKLIRDLWGIS